MTQGEPSDVRLDVSGHRCPLPALKARRRLAELEPNAILHLIATDPMAKIDIPHFCNEQGHDLLATWAEGDQLHFRIRRK
ncbi:MAG: sulfurtransferase TusA family protein [Aestuariivirgaceae bacterium]|nr:sulfurtransferase TusA family protein [Aestuariivirgaceae bacterium]